VDTAGRLHVDEEMMSQLAAVRDAVKPHNVLLVLDSMTGQEAVTVAEAFAELAEALREVLALPPTRTITPGTRLGGLYLKVGRTEKSLVKLNELYELGHQDGRTALEDRRFFS